MKVMFHASPKKGLKLIRPQRTISGDVYIGDYVFATLDECLAAMYLATKGTPILMNTKAKPPTIVICAEQNEYIASDGGGAIYTLPTDNFHKTPQEGLEESELISKKPVKPLGSQSFRTSLEAMEHYGIQVYFVDEETFNKLVKAKDESEIISTLKPYNS